MANHKQHREAIMDKSPLERLEQSLKEMKLMREGKLPKRNWREMMAKIKSKRK
jgi:hypothetical protein